MSISIHAPHEGERHSIIISSLVAWIYFNPRSPRGGATAFAVRKICLILQFQSTLPTRGSDFVQNCKRGNMAIRFQSTLPTRGSDDKALYSAVRPFGISIHAPHEGERRISPCGQYPCHAFQSTLPTRGSDGLVALINHEIDGFQSTLPTRGSDDVGWLLTPVGLNFNPRSPRGGATHCACQPDN